MERGSEYDVTAKLVIRHEQELSATLTEQQKAILEKIKDNLTELMSFGERDAFCQALRHPILPCVAQIKSAQSYPNKPNKSLTGDLWAIVSAISEGEESAAD